jgi:hypothetical protein
LNDRRPNATQAKNPGLAWLRPARAALETSMTEYLTEKQVAELLGIAEHAVFLLCRSKKIAHSKIAPGVRIFTLEDVDAYVRSQRVEAASWSTAAKEESAGGFITTTPSTAGNAKQNAKAKANALPTWKPLSSKAN